MATADMMTAIMTQTMLKMNTCYPAKVISAGESSAKIQPLFMTKEFNEDAETIDPLDDIPYLMQRYELHNSSSIGVFIPGGLENHYSITYNEPVLFKPVLKPGDIVLCIVAQRSLDDVMGGTPYLPSKARIMNLQDSVIIGVVQYA